MLWELDSCWNVSHNLCIADMIKAKENQSRETHQCPPRLISTCKPTVCIVNTDPRVSEIELKMLSGSGNHQKEALGGLVIEGFIAFYL